MKFLTASTLVCVLPLAGCVAPASKIPDQGARLDEAEINRRVEASIIKRQEEEDVARTPGFESTTKSGREVMKLALDCAQKSGGDLSLFRAPTISLMKKDGKMQWLVHWEVKGSPMPGGFFAVWVDDETGVAELSPGM